ncbi:F-box/kelch-repeat protein At3g06240-like [Henckelia pumila]|uniref:F-box/kelch-repeat protein At3g06240-like n=1 Tax=Henckelia pumila TaxID=405737 RepID=UPI003C6DBB02
MKESWTKVTTIPFVLDFRDHEFIRPLETITYCESLVSPNLEDEIVIGRTLPSELISEILLRLPVKYLLRFTAVSKGWLSLISSSQFAKTHHKLSTKSNVFAHDRLIFGSRTSPIYLFTCSLNCTVADSVSSGFIFPEIDKYLQVQAVSLDYPHLEPDDRIWFLGSCHGLVCVSLPHNTLMLWNPVTRQSKVLTNLVVEFFSFERVTGSHMLEIQVNVYSLRANSWTILSNWPGGDAFGGSGKYLNGAIHYILVRHMVRQRILGTCSSTFSKCDGNIQGDKRLNAIMR